MPVRRPHLGDPDDEVRLKQIGTDIWVADGFLPRKSCGIEGRMPVRMTIIRLTASDDDIPRVARYVRQRKRNLLVICPFELTKSLRSQIRGVGRVKYVFIPNALHWPWAGQFKKAYNAPDKKPRWTVNTPECKVVQKGNVLMMAESDEEEEESEDEDFIDDYHVILLGVSKLRDKLLKTRPEEYLLYDGFLQDERDAPAEWVASNDLDLVRVRGFDAMSEFLLFHRVSQTLIVTDLFFNLTRPRHTASLSWPPWCWYVHLTGIAGRPCFVSRLYYYFMESPGDVCDTLRQVLEHWDFVQLVVGHGNIIQTDAKRVLRETVITQLEGWLVASPFSPPREIATKSVVGIGAIAVAFALLVRALK